MTNTAKTPATTQVLQQIYLRISLGSWVGYTLRTIPKGRALLDSSGNQTQEYIYAPTKRCLHPAGTSKEISSGLPQDANP